MPTEPVAITAAKIQAESIDRQVNLSFLLKDFEKIFDMYLYSHSERSEATKMFVMLSTVPFVLISLFGIAGNVSMQDKSLIEVVEQFPNFMFLIFSVFGFAGIVPFHRFVTAYSNTYKMIRYMNGYRLFYYQLIKDETDLLKWRSAIEKDPRIPQPSANRFHWTTGFAFAMFIVNTAYVCIGIWLWDGQASSFLIPALAALMFIIHFVLARQELHADDVVRLEGRALPVDDILKSIDGEVK